MSLYFNLPILFLWLNLLLSAIANIFLNLFLSYQSVVFSSFLGLFISIGSSELFISVGSTELFISIGSSFSFLIFQYYPVFLVEQTLVYHK